MSDLTYADMLAIEEAAAGLEDDLDDPWPSDWTIEQIHEALIDSELTVAEADLSTEGRKKMAESGTARPDGSFPIPNVAYLKKAISAFGRAVAAGKGGAVKAWIIQRAKALKATNLLPSDWSVQEADREEPMSAIREAAEEQVREVLEASDGDGKDSEGKGDEKADKVFCLRHKKMVTPTKDGKCPIDGGKLPPAMKGKGDGKAKGNPFAKK